MDWSEGIGTGENDGDITQAIVHNRRMMINIAFRNLVKASTSLSVRRNQHSKHMTIAASFACRSMLWRGYQALLRLSPRTKRVKALQWRINHILTLTFGAWVRFSATSRQDREDNLKASEFYEQFLLSRGLDKCKTLVSRKQCAFSAESLAELFHRLLSFKRYLLIFKNQRQRQRQRQRQNVVFTERQRYLIFEESPELQCFLTKKAKLSALTCFTRLHLKSAKKNSKSKRSFQSPYYYSLIRNAFIVLRLKKEGKIYEYNEESKSEKHFFRRKLCVGFGKLKRFAFSRKNKREQFNQKFSIFINRSPRKVHSSCEGDYSDYLADVIVKIKLRQFMQRFRVARHHEYEQRADIVSKYKYFLEKRLLLYLHIWRRHSRRRTQLQKFLEFQVVQHQRIQLFKVCRASWYSWRRKYRNTRLKRAYIRESLKFYSIDWDFRSCVSALGVWKRLVSSIHFQRKCLISAKVFWRHARLARVFALFRSRFGQDTGSCTSCTTYLSYSASSMSTAVSSESSSTFSSSSAKSTKRSDALWKSGLGSADVESRGGKPCVLFFSLVNRSHQVLACNQWENRRLSLYMCALMAHATTCAHSRVQRHRATWFWKYWREAIAIQRWKTRVVCRRKRRDALRMAAVDYKVAIGRTVLRRWITKISSMMTTTANVTPAAVTSRYSASGVIHRDMLDMHRIQCCFSEWRSQVPSRMPLADHAAPSPTYPILTESSLNVSSSQPATIGSTVLLDGGAFLSASSTIPKTDQPMFGMGSANNLVTAKPRVPLYLLHPPSGDQSKASSSVSCASLDIYMSKHKSISGSTSCTASALAPFPRPIPAEVKTAISSSLTNGISVHQGEGLKETNNSHAPSLIISDLENAIAEIENKTLSFLHKEETNPQVNRQIEKRRLAEFLKQYADEIDQLNARTKSAFL